MSSTQRKVADDVKARLFGLLRERTSAIDYLDYHKYHEELERIHSLLVGEWLKIEREFRDIPGIDLKRLKLKGYLFEALFYYACLKSQAYFVDAEILEISGERFEESPPWFEATPLYDIIPSLHRVGKERKAPQTDADFIVSYADDKGPSPPSLVDVKSRKPRPTKRNKERWSPVLCTVQRGPRCSHGSRVRRNEKRS